MALATNVPAGSTNRRFYKGPVGVGTAAPGVPANVDFDLLLNLPAMPEAILEDPTFRDNWIVFVRQVDAGVTAVSADVEFLPAASVPPAAPVMPTTLRLSITSDNDANEVDIEFWHIHSVPR